MSFEQPLCALTVIYIFIILDSLVLQVPDGSNLSTSQIDTKETNDAPFFAYIQCQNKRLYKNKPDIDMV